MLAHETMSDPEIVKLLILQDKDIQLIRSERELRNIPLERHRLKVEAEEEEAGLAEAKSRLMRLEVERKEIENEVLRLEEQVRRYKNQQLEVKKNEEYQALTQEIDRATARIGELEEEEIRLMLAIDEEKLVFAGRTRESAARVEKIGSEIELLNQKQAHLESQCRELAEEVERCRSVVSELFLQGYDQAKRNLKDRPPFVSPIENGICRRSNLKVSNELLQAARDPASPSFDDATGCMVYIP